MNNLSFNKTATMSSTEISCLTGKRKNDIHQDIKVQLFIGLYGLKDGGDFHHEKIQGVTVVLDNRGYWSEVHLDREHTLTLITGYDVKSRHTINQRWLELESQQPKLPTNYLEALKELVVVTELSQEQDLQIKAQKLIIETKDDLIRASNEASVKAGEILIREFVKAVDIIDLGEKQFYRWMREQGIVSDKNEPYQQYVKTGYFTYKPSEKLHGGEYRYTLRVTPRGKVWLAARYMAYLDTLGFSTPDNNGVLV